jgi:uncharacterized phage-associated protein
MVDCKNIASYFISQAYKSGRERSMTNMKVQKLLYYTQSLHLALQDEVLFDQEIQAWRYGPVCPPVYKFYCKFEAQQLPVPDQKDFINSFSMEQRHLLEEVWMHFGEHNAFMLSDMTHAEFPWKKARKGLPEDARSTEPILIEDLKLLGQEKLDEIERGHPAYSPIIRARLEETFSAGNKSTQYIKPGDVRDWLTSLLD